PSSILPTFFFELSPHNLALHSFPTRRSSDLEAVMAAVEAETFLILPHPEVLDMYRMKGSDYDRWIRGMRRYQAKLRGSSASRGSDRKSTRLNSSHVSISYAVFCLKRKTSF